MKDIEIFQIGLQMQLNKLEDNTLATKKILLAQIEKYEDVPGSVAEL